MLSLTKPDYEVLDALVRDQRDEDFTYADVGGTGVPEARLPRGYWHGRHSIDLGHGEEVFHRARQGLRQWQGHIRAGVDIHPLSAPLQEGVALALAVRVGFLYLTVANRIISVADEPARFGFAYGTLPHHVIEGEEAFLVERDEVDAVRFFVWAFMRPRGPIMTAAGPAVRVLDQRLVRKYLQGLREHVSAPAGSSRGAS